MKDKSFKLQICIFVVKDHNFASETATKFAVLRKGMVISLKDKSFKLQICIFVVKDHNFASETAAKFAVLRKGVIIKMARKTNKTDHVLNLLTTHEEDKNEKDASPVTTAPNPTAHNSKPKKTIEIENGSSDLLSDTIRSELERQFEISSQQTATIKGMPLTSNKSLSGKEEKEMTNTEQSTQQQADSADSYTSTNIVEDLVRTKAPEFIKSMGGCTCHRCLNDIIAITLNTLPPKYIVTQKGMLFAKISAYENQYSTDVTAALTRACIQAKSSPRH